MIPATTPKPTTIDRCVEDGSRRLREAGLPTPKLDARLLLCSVLETSKESLIASGDDEVSSQSLQRYEQLLARRLAHEPVAYLRGVKEFWSLSMHVDRRVLIPRPDTEILVEACIEGLSKTQGAVVADVGTGSGAIAVALACERSDLRVIATDISADALTLARRNITEHGFEDRVTTLESDLLDGVDQTLHCIAANLPYVSTPQMETLDPGVRDHEPRLALHGGPDGLDLVRRLIDQADDHLCQGGLIALEVADDQTSAVHRHLSQQGFEQTSIRKDLGRLKRVVTARRAT